MSNQGHWGKIILYSKDIRDMADHCLNSALAMPHSPPRISNSHTYFHTYMDQLKALLNASAAPWPVEPCAAEAARVQASMVAWGARHLSLSCWPKEKREEQN